jgi:hypothetical protein
MPDLLIARIVSERTAMALGEPALEVEFEDGLVLYPRSVLAERACGGNWAEAYLARLDRLLARENPYDTTCVDAVVYPRCFEVTHVAEVSWPR